MFLLKFKKRQHQCTILMCPTGKKSGVNGPDRSIKCAIVLMVPCKRSWCTVEFCPAWLIWNHMEQRPVPLHPAPSQVNGDSVYLQLSRGIHLDSAHLVDSRAAQSVICSYRIVYIDIVLYFSSSNIVSWDTPQMVYQRSIDCCYLLID